LNKNNTSVIENSIIATPYVISSIKLLAYRGSGGAIMTKKSFGPQNWLYPMPAVLVGVTVDGNPNFMTAAWCGIVASNPPTLMVGIRPTRYTYKGIEEQKVFSINIPSANLVREVDYCGIVSGRKEDKARLFTLFYGTLKTAPLIEECPVNLECKMTHTADVGSHIMCVGEIVETFVSEACLTEDKVDVKKIDPLIFSAPDQNYWRLGGHIAKAFHVGVSGQ